MFGWKRQNGLRRFQTVYFGVPRKNGKTTFAVPIGLYMMILDSEAGAEIYSAATKRDQARL
jgi:phage terminase large subunit-like protein